MHMTPVGVVGNSYILHQHRCVVCGRDSESLQTIGGGYNHTVAIGLLDKVFVTLYEACLTAL